MKAAIVVRFHGSDLYEHTNVNYIPFREKQLKRLDGAAFISEMGKKYLTNRFPFLKDKSFVARLGTHDFGINSFQRTDKIHMVSCSNVVPVKRIHLIAQCLQFLSISVKWTHIGDGPLMADMKKLIQHIPSFVDAQFAGFMNHDQLMEFYKTNSISLFINVSSSEGIPVSVLEALSFGIPVIATDVGGTSEIIDHSVGFLVSPEITPKMLAEKIELLSQSENYQGLRIAARERWENMGREDQLYPEFIQKLLAVKT